MAKKNFWGGANTSKDYLMLVAGSTPISKPEELVGHTFTNFQIEQIDRVTAVGVELVRGKIRERQRTLRRAQQTGITFTVGFGSQGEFYTPLLQKVEQGDCEVTIYIKRLCPPKSENAHFYAVPEAVFDRPTFVNDMITVDETTNVVTQQAEASAPEFIKVYQVGGYKVADLVPPLYAIAALTPECEDCEGSGLDSFVVGGGVAGVADEPYLAITEDRFSSMTVLTSGIPTASGVRGIYADGDRILAAFADTQVIATGATGGTVFSADRGDSFTIDSNITAPIHAVGYFDGQYVAAGGIGGGAAPALLYVSDDGVTWTAVSDSDIPADETFTALAVDEENEAIYIAGTGGTFLKGTKSGTTIQLSAVALPSSPTSDLLAVAVYGNGHIAVAGASNYLAESFDEGETWVQPSAPGSASINGLAGTQWLRYVMATGLVLGVRDILTDNEFSVKTLQAGATVTGDYTAIVGVPDNPNYFVAVTDDGEVTMLKPFYPGA